jgi:hypothetical protein
MGTAAYLAMVRLVRREPNIILMFSQKVIITGRQLKEL